VLQARCRPACTLAATAEVRTGRRVRRLGRRTLGTAGADRAAGRVAFTLTAAEQRLLTRALRRGPVAVTVRVRATRRATARARAVRTVTLRR
jgi:hypothetical protein